MWFAYVAVLLILAIAAGIYVQRRLAAALSQLGASARAVRAVRWVTRWLLFGFPGLLILTILLSRVLDRPTVPRYDGRLAAWLLAVPFVGWVLVIAQSVPWLLAIDAVALVARRVRDAAHVARLRALAMLAVIAAFAIYTPVRVIAQRGELRVRHHEVGRPGATGEPLRIAFLADVQQDVHTDGERAREVYALVNASHPDFVLSGGDWINTGPDYIEDAAAAAGTLHGRLGTLSVRGDHEHFAYADRERSVAEIERAMRAHGVDMGHDEVRWLAHCGKRIAVVLLDNNYIHRPDRATVESLIASTAGADYAIVVTHQLDRRLAALLAGKVDLVLAGHTHGGQVNPVIGVSHVSLARLETDMVDGRYPLGTTTVIVTAGIGYSIVPFRYASPGSIELIDLRLCGPRA